MVAGQYRHRQTGWVIIAVTGASLALAAVLLLTANLAALGAAAFGLIAVALLLFHSLTITIDDRELTFKLGVGLIGKRIPLSEIRHFSRMRSRWYYGWGIRITPKGVLYAVSGYDAVQLVLKSGRRLCLGTDEPDKLLEALQQTLGAPKPLSAQEAQAVVTGARRQWLVAAAGVLLFLTCLLGAFYLEARPPKFSVENQQFRIDSFLYGERMPLSALTAVELTHDIPKIRARTNGFAVGNTLRGHFRLDELGDGQLFIEAGSAPYVLARTQDRYVIFNYADKATTRKSFIKLSAARMRQQQGVTQAQR